MKKKVGIIRRVAALTAALLFCSAFVFAEGETTEVYLTGTSNSSAGDYVVQTTNDIFHYQGREYEVFRVYYDNPEANMKIAVHKTDGQCRSWVAYTDEYMFFYCCTKDGFGVRKVMFSNPWVKDEYSALNYRDQSVLVKQSQVEKKEAVGLIAAYVPQLKG